MSLSHFTLPAEQDRLNAVIQEIDALPLPALPELTAVPRQEAAWVVTKMEPAGHGAESPAALQVEIERRLRAGDHAGALPLLRELIARVPGNAELVVVAARNAILAPSGDTEALMPFDEVVVVDGVIAL